MGGAGGSYVVVVPIWYYTQGYGLVRPHWIEGRGAGSGFSFPHAHSHTHTLPSTSAFLGTLPEITPLACQ